MQPYSSRLPWIQVGEHPQGGFVVADSRTGERAYAPTRDHVHSFAAAHSAQPGYRGLGDVVRGVTKRLGIGECSPCARRHAALNAVMPRVFRR